VTLPTPAPAPVVRFGPRRSHGELGAEFQLDTEGLELRRDGQPVAMRPNVVRALAVLLAHGDRLVPADELRRQLWGEQHLEWPNALHQVVRELRRALGDDARRPRFVSTVPRLGYRFVGERMSTPASGSRRPATGRFGRALRWPPGAFAAGFATAVLLPVAFVVVCALLAG
jgi:DNA-binding winged helix-turn-helix (wHTH) protein